MFLLFDGCRDEAKTDDTFEPNVVGRAKLFDKTPIVSRKWGGSDHEAFIASKQLLYVLNTSKDESEPVPYNPLIIKSESLKPAAIYKCVYGDIMDIAFIGNSNRIFMACDDGSSRLLDLSTQRVIAEMRDHTGTIEVCDTRYIYVHLPNMSENVSEYL